MSMILQAIDDIDDLCLYDQSSGKEEAILVNTEEAVGENKDESLDEKEKVGDGVGEDDGDELWRALEALAKYNDEIEEDESGDEDEGECDREGIICANCLAPDHFVDACPLERGIYSSSTVPVVNPDYRVLCQHCGKSKFTEKDSFQTCIKCGCNRMCAVLIRCYYCLECGHKNKKDPQCVLYGKRLTRENDPLRHVYCDREDQLDG